MASRRPMCIGPQVHVADVAPLVGLESASETFVEGAILISDTGDSNRLAEGGTDPLDIFGIAAKAASGTASAAMPYYPAFPDVVFEGSIDTSASLGTGTSAATDFGANYGVTKDTSGFWYVDKNKTDGAARVRIVGFRDPVGTVLGRVYFVFNLQ